MEKRESKSEKIEQSNKSIAFEIHDKLSEIHNHIKTLIKKGCSKNDLVEVFFTLSFFFETQLINEELYLKKMGYPYFDNLRISHSDFMKGIERLKDNYDRDIDTTLKELDIFVGEWLQNHSSNENREV